MEHGNRTLRARPFALCLLLFAGLSCASPRPPSGGPPDQTPPDFEATVPAAGATNVDVPEIRLTFTEYVDQGSFTRALSITPEPDGRLDVDWSKRTVRIRLPEPLRENTTYVLTLDTNLRDAHSVTLKQPLTLAFSSGPTLNQGRLAGRVLDAASGTGIAGIDVLAYAVPDSTAPDSLPGRPAYRTQTDEEGLFALTYLSRQPYYVVALQDRNRNRRPDPRERFAVPPRPALIADSTVVEATRRWLVTALDTTAPVLQRVRPRSSRRLELRFSEAVRLTSPDTTAWLLEDSLAARAVAVQTVYTVTDEPLLVYVLTDSLAAVPHRIRPGRAVVDSSGIAAGPDAVGFTPPALPDTLRLRFRRFLPPGDVLAPQQQPAVQFNQPVTDDRFSTLVTVEDSLGQSRAFTRETTDGTTYRLRLTPPLALGEPVRIRVDGRRAGGVDTVYTRTIRRVAERQLGSLSGAVTAEDTTGVIVVELYRTDGDTPTLPYATLPADASGGFLFENLPEGTYRFRAFVDRDANGHWDGGRVVPYRPAEPVIWSVEPPAWRARWESSLADTLRIPSE